MPLIKIGDVLRRHRLEPQFIEYDSLTQKELADLIGCHNSVISRVERDDQLPTPEYLQRFVDVMNLPDDQAQKIWALLDQDSAASSSTSKELTRQDWGEAPDVRHFCGRQTELTKLVAWSTSDRCRLIAILGMGGIGKTNLVTKLATEIKTDFDFVIWRSLRNAPPVNMILEDCVKFLTDQPEVDIPSDNASLMTLFLDTLKQKRCLIILDNFETILKHDTHAGHYKFGYEDIGLLLQRIGEMPHQSCVVLTSREQPKEFGSLASYTGAVRTLKLSGLTYSESYKLLRDRELYGKKSAWALLIERYNGNPLALKQVTATIQDLYGGNIQVFLEEITTMFGDIRYLLDQQFGRLSKLEQDIMFWLAINREQASVLELGSDLTQAVTPGKLLEALESLHRRSLIEKSKGQFTLQNVISEYLIEQLVHKVYEELTMEKIELFHSHALVKAQTKTFVRDSQTRLILMPLSEKLISLFGQSGLRNHLFKVLKDMQKQKAVRPGYAVGNIINLLSFLGVDLDDCDFSHLPIWQAYLRSKSLANVDFSFANFKSSVFTDAFGSILSVAFHPNGQIVAAGTNDGKIHLWDAKTASKLFSFEGHNDWVWSVVFDPSGKNIVSSGADRLVKIWDLEEQICKNIIHGHKGRIWEATLSFDGKLLATGSGDRSICIWDVETGTLTRKQDGFPGEVRSVAFSPVEEHLLATASKQKLQLWNILTGELKYEFPPLESDIRHVAFNTNGMLLACGCEDGTIKIWSLTSKKQQNQPKTLQGHSNMVRSVAFDPSGKALASGGNDKTVRLWSIEKGQGLTVFKGHTSWVRTVAFSPDGKYLASGSDDRTVRIWDTKTGQCINSLEGYHNQVRSVAINPEGTILATGNENKSVQLWDVVTGHCLKTLMAHTSRVRTVAFSPNGDTLVSGSDDQTVRLWNVHTGEGYKILTAHTNRVRSVAFSPDGHIFASAGSDQIIFLWKMITGTLLQKLEGHTGQIRSITFDAGGDILVSGSEDNTARIWNVKTGECLKLLQGHTGWVRSVSFSPDGAILATGSDDQTLRLWDVASGDLLKVFAEHSSQIWVVGFSKKGNMLASGGNDNHIFLWNIVSGKIITRLAGHDDKILSLVFTPGDQRLVSSSSDGTVKLWDIERSACIRTFRSDRPYERMDITGVTGLSSAQIASLKALGAVEQVADNPAL